jgi:hypothetical protein
MLESCGILTNMNVAEALDLFCSVVNASGQVFHSVFFWEEIEKNRYTHDGKEKSRCFTKSEDLAVMLKSSYAKAVDKHNKNCSIGPLPNEITLQVLSSHRRTLLNYKTFNGTTIRLVIPKYRSKIKYCTIMVLGKHWSEVCSRAYITDLPKPVSVKNVWKDFPPKFARPVTPTTPSIRDIRVPLGEIFDLIRDTPIPFGSLLSIIEKYR